MDVSDRNGLEIAVIGMSCRLPGADSVEEYWSNLMAKEESIKFFDEEELVNRGVSRELRNKKNYVGANGILKKEDSFDAGFFDYSGDEASILHPQGRKLHECVYEALEQAGYPPFTYDGEIGLYAGTGSSTMWEAYIAYHEKNSRLGKFSSSFLSDKDYLISNIAYKLNLKGPNVSVKSACSTSLVAVHLACRALLTGECEIAVAGGATIAYGNRAGYLYEDGSVYSRDGHCRAFDSDSSGTVPSDGVGVVVLKPLDAAIEDGDHIFGVIKGTAINGDGNEKVGYAAPGVSGEIRVMEDCLNVAEVNPSTIDYIEAHGTGTSLGDMVELEALRAVYKTQEHTICTIGSVKSNIGHTDSASGIAGLIKLILCLYHKTLVPSLHFGQLNPKINNEDGFFFVNTTCREWVKTNDIRRGAVSSFGIGGTNAHLIAEEFVPEDQPEASVGEQLIIMSARSDFALTELKERFVKACRAEHAYPLADMASALQTKRQFFEQRTFTIASDREEATDHFCKNTNKVFTNQHCDTEKEAVFMFPGQGLQYRNMGRELYESFPPFREEMERCFLVLEQLDMGYVKEFLYPPTDYLETEVEPLHLSSMINFIVEYSLARMVISIGIKPNVLVGHSIGEYACACVGGILRLEDAVLMVKARGELMNQLPAGIMMSVPLAYSELKQYVDGTGIAIAADHGMSCLVSGLEEDINRFQKNMMEKRLICQKLNVKVAGHSAAMNEMLGQYRAVLSKVEYLEEAIPIVSTVTGKLITEEMKTADYWLGQITGTVHFSDAIQTIVDIKTPFLYLEVGSGNVLSRIVMQQDRAEQVNAINMLKFAGQKITDYKYLLEKIGFYWLYGGKIDFKRFPRESQRRSVPVITYPFESIRFSYKHNFLEERDGFLSNNNQRAMNKDWYYIPSWKRALLSREEREAELKRVVYLVDENSYYSTLKDLIAEREQKPIWVHIGQEFRVLDSNAFMINPEQKSDFVSLIQSLQGQGNLPNKYVFLWGLKEKGSVFDMSRAAIDREQQLGFVSMNYLAAAYGTQNIQKKAEFVYVTNDTQKVLNSKVYFPQMATVYGSIKIIPAEYPQISCKSIDLSLQHAASKETEQSLNAILDELERINKHVFIAYRDGIRYIQSTQKIEVLDSVEASPMLKDQKVYLLVGGLGGIGYQLASYISAAVNHSVIILMQRSEIEYRDKRLDALRINQNQIDSFAVDISNREALEDTVKQIYAQYKTINGVLFCAGVNDGSLIYNFDEQMRERAFSAKLYGTIALHQCLNKEELDFYFFCSSFNVLLSSIGTVGYTGANMFIDSFAAYTADQEQIETRCINWFAWKSVGGAVKNIENLLRLSSNNKLPSYPEFEAVFETAKEAVYATKIGWDSSWVIAEHKLGHVEIMPGTGFLDLVARIVERRFQTETFSLKDIYYIKPFCLEEGDLRSIAIKLEQVGESFEFTIESAGLEGAEDKLQHVKGMIELSVPANHKKNYSQEIINSSQEEMKQGTQVEKDKEKRLLFGERWMSSIKEIKLGHSGGMLALELPNSFQSDLETHFLHPALTDLAFGTVSDGKEFFLPFYFKALHVYGRLTGKLYSFAAIGQQSEKNSSINTFSYKVVDESGNLLLEAEDYTLVQAKNAVEETLVEAKSKKDEKNLKDAVIEKSAEGWLSPEEGENVFHNVMNSELNQVIICPYELEAYLAKQAKPQKLYEEEPVLSVKRKRIAVTEFAEPMDEVQEKLVEIWREVLGLDEIGIYDNFFDLGANSLNIIQVNGNIQRELDREISVVSYYVNPTISELAAFLAGGNTEQASKDMPPSENGRNRLRKRKENMIRSSKDE